MELGEEEEVDLSNIENSDASEEDFSEEEAQKNKKTSKAAPRAKAASKAPAKASTSKVSAAVSKTTSTSRGRKKAADPIIELDDEDVHDHFESAKAPTSGSRVKKAVVNLADDDIEESPPLTASTKVASSIALPTASQSNTQKTKQRQLPLSFTQASVKSKPSKSGNLASGWDD
jgi:hypothetical protein